MKIAKHEYTNCTQFLKGIILNNNDNIKSFLKVIVFWIFFAHMYYKYASPVLIRSVFYHCVTNITDKELKITP